MGSGGSAVGLVEVGSSGCAFDPGLAANIQIELEVDNAAGVHHLTDLNVDYEPYGSLAGIECLANLERLQLAYYFYEGERPVIDLSPLASLGKLTELSLTTIGFTRLEVVADRLRNLRLWFVEAGSLEPLRDFDQLEQLDISGLPAADLSPLSGLDSLKTLTLDYMPVSTLAPLSGLPALETLTLWTLEMRDFQGFVNLPRLKNLHILDTAFESFEGIAEVPNLVSVRVEGCEQLRTLDGLEGCAGLQTIEVLPLINDGPALLSDVGALTDVATLRTLDVAGAKVSDISALSGCPALEHLNLEANQVADLSPLTGLPLQWLDVSSNQVVAIDALADMPLSTLRISHNPIASLAPLGTLTGLAELAMDGLGATSLELLRGAPITQLYASDNALRDIDLVMEWDLANLILKNNEITSLPEGFLGARGFCALTDLTGNPLDDAAKGMLDALCATPSLEGYTWDGSKDCHPVCEVP